MPCLRKALIRYNRQDQIYEEIGWTDNGQIVIQDTDVFSNTSLGKI